MDFSILISEIYDLKYTYISERMGKHMGLFGQSKKEILAEKAELQQEVSRLQALLRPEHNTIEKLNEIISDLEQKSSELDSTIEDKKKNVSNLYSESMRLTGEINTKRSQIVGLDNELSLQEYGIYRPNYVFSNSDHYKAELSRIRDAQKQCVKNDTACSGSKDWTVNGNAAKGRAMVKDMKKLLLRAFNVECDDIVDGVKISNFDKSIERIYRISDQISKLGSIMSIRITQQYISLKIEEVKLALDFQQKKQEEKERLKELREQEREAAKVQKEIEEERKKLAKEQKQYSNALAAVLAQIEKNGESADLLAKKEEMEKQLDEIAKAITDVDYRSANQKAGYVYIISNIGSFGENVYKIGMTRRLNPQERIDELGDASVPFDFDVHALIFSEDAPKLEHALHQAFERHKVNKVNTRREFFRVSLDEIKAEVRKNFDKTVEWIDIADAEQYRQSLIYK